MNVTRYSYLNILLLFALMVAPGLVRAQDAPSEQVLAGEKLFKSQCASCHKLNAKLIGPALEGVEARWADGGDHDGVSGRDWLKRWIKNWQDPYDAGNPYAITMEGFDASAMTQFPQLQDADLEAILAYIANPPAPKTADVPAGGGGTGEPAENPYTGYILWGLLLLLVAVSLVLMRVSNLLNRLVLEKEGSPIPAPVPFWKNKKLRAALTLLVVIYIGNATVTGAIDLGRQQGYMPEQPIKFSHELHAGINKIDCQYCHSSASESKHSNIPTTNVCMNCHKGIKGDDPKNGKYGKLEISKIYAAAGFDPIAGNYFENKEEAYIDSIFKLWLSDSKVPATNADIEAVLAQVNKPVEWVRIHNMPDHVYFNHSQHVTAGGIECQTCHGPVETMEELYQFSPLSMGWCVNCHRETEVKFSQNPYYESFKVYHERLQDGEMKNVTVENIGGTECQKCHY